MRIQLVGHFAAARHDDLHPRVRDRLESHFQLSGVEPVQRLPLAILAKPRPGPIADLDLCSRGSYEDGHSAAPPEPLKRSPRPNFYKPRFRHALTSVRSDRTGQSVSGT